MKYGIIGTQERRNAGTQERRNAGTQERRNAGTQERRNAGTQERVTSNKKYNYLSKNNAGRILRVIVDKKYRFAVFAKIGLYDKMPDEEFLRRAFKLSMGYELDLENPKTFNEKLNWLKIHNRKPEYTQMVDKYGVKSYVAEKLGSEYVIPLLGVYDNFDEIDFNKLPDKFVFKCTHDCGGLAICRDKANFDIKPVRKKFNRSLKINYFRNGREWPYKNVKPRIIAEQYMQDGDKQNLPVYKIFNFGGEPKIIQAIQDDKTADETIDYFDTDWNKLNLRQNFPNSKTPLPRPKLLDDMLTAAAKLSVGIPFVRTDLYTINNKIYFSEFTFFSDGGMTAFDPPEWDEILGSWIKLK